jgi:N-acetylneuraminic acid mutarotase
MSELTIETIPHEMLSYILSFLNASQLAICCGTNHLFYELGSHSLLWRDLCQSQWPEQFERRAGDELSLSKLHETYALEDSQFWKRYFAQKFLLESKAETLTWTQISLSSSSVGSVKPGPRYAHSGTVIDNKIVYIGGQVAQKQRFNDFYYYDTETGQFNNPKPKGNPPNISKHTSMEIDGMFYVFGGYDGVDQRFELSLYDPKKLTWETPQTYGDRPISRSNHASAVIGKKMYVFGGLLQQGNELIDSNDLHVFDAPSMTWTLLRPEGEAPEARCGHKMVSVDNKLYLFGGGNGDNWSNKFNDLFVYDPSSNEWYKPKTTGCFVDSTTFASLFTIGRFIFVFGGGRITNRGCVSNEIYTFDTVARHWSKQNVSGKAPGERDDCTTNVVGDVIYMMHGYNSGPIDEFWSIKMLPSLYRTVYQCEPPVRVIKESSSPLLSLSPTLKRMKQKLMNISPFTRRHQTSRA